jgi:hypothetical protein
MWRVARDGQFRAARDFRDFFLRIVVTIRQEIDASAEASG